MSIYIVDTNIVFSAILNPENQIADILLNSADCFEFHAPAYLRLEIEKHRDRILSLSNLGAPELEELKLIIFSRIKFINEEIIPFEIWRESARILRDIDSDDVAFLAASKFFDKDLWTGDRKLIKGLLEKGFNRLITTNELVLLRDEQIR